MNNDSISREALRQAMYHEAMESDSDEQRWDSGCWIRYKMFERVIESIPSVERKNGTWIDETFKPWGLVYHPYRCDQCGDHADCTYNYCPNCGADMRGEEE